MARWDHDVECHWWCTKVRWRWFWGICFEIFELFLCLNWRLCPKVDTPSPYWFKDCLVQQQFTFDSCDLLPGSHLVQYILLSWIPSCFRLVNMCFLQFSLRSRCSPKYLASSAWGILKPFKITGGHIFLRKLPVQILPHWLWFSIFLAIFGFRKVFLVNAGMLLYDLCEPPAVSFA